MDIGEIVKKNAAALVMGVIAMTDVYINMKLTDAEHKNYMDVNNAHVEAIENRLRNKIEIIEDLQKRVIELEKCK